MTRLDELTTIFRAFLQDTLISADITLQLNEEDSCRVIEIDLDDDDDKAHVGALLQSLLSNEISNAEDILIAGRNVMGEPVNPEFMFYDVRVQQEDTGSYNTYNVKAACVDDALQIAFCLDGGVKVIDGNYGGPRGLLSLARMYAEIVK